MQKNLKKFSVSRDGNRAAPGGAVMGGSDGVGAVCSDGNINNPAGVTLQYGKAAPGERVPDAGGEILASRHGAARVGRQRDGPHA